MGEAVNGNAPVVQARAPDFSYLIGHTTEEARELAPNYTVRITRVDGQPCLGTREVNMKRINVWVRNKVIVVVAGLG